MGEIGYIPKNVDNDKNLAAYYIAETEISNVDLRNHLKKILPDYMIPTHFKRVESFPLTDNGKVDRKALRDLGGYFSREKYRLRSA